MDRTHAVSVRLDSKVDRTIPRIAGTQQFIPIGARTIGQDKDLYQAFGITVSHLTRVFTCNQKFSNGAPNDTDNNSPEQSNTVRR